MRTILTTILNVLLICGIYAQSTDQNYISIHTKLDSLGVNELVQIQYYDGLGRPVQNVQKAFTPLGKDLITNIEYDYCGRTTRNWLPTPVANSQGYLKPNIFATISKQYYIDAKPFEEIKYYDSGGSYLDKIVGKQLAGADLGNNYKHIDKGTNTQNQIYMFVVNANDKLQNMGYYAYKTLTYTKIVDEDGKTVTEYKDKYGRVIMNLSSTNVRTYYAYNNLGQLCYVIPPIAADNLTAQSVYNDDNDNLKKYCYLYKYDERGNNVVKRLPGCDSICMVYDKADRLIFSQDGNQRLKKQWTITKYDVFGRLVYTGYLTRDQKRTELKAILDPLVITESYNGSTSFANTGYTCNHFASEITPILVNYYDSYKFRRLLTAADSTSLKYVTAVGYDAQYGEDKVKGMLTGTRTYILNQKATSFLEKVSYLTNAFYYDAYGRVVQTRGTNHLAGYECAYNHYDFTGKLLMNKKTHGPLTVTEITRNEYDNVGRLIKVRYKIDTKDTVTLAQYSYDELGRPIQKIRHNGIDTAQFAYNIRNWTTKIKSGTFEEKLYYNANPASSTPCFNGNISYSTWTYNGTLKGYAYTYDNLNRLTNATYALNHVKTDDFYYYEETFSYDKMGNIDRLTRNDGEDTRDNLVLAYNGNQLKKVDDDYGSQNQYNLKEYQDKIEYGISTEEFAYDANGNMIKDLDRDIVAIRYNLLNLPDTVQFKTGNQIVNRYTASGQKIRAEYFTQVTYITPLTTGTVIPQRYTYGVVDQTGSAYVDNVEYKTTNGSSYSKLRIYNSEGYATGLGYLNYYRKDHLGNNREVWQAGYSGLTASTVQRTQYYPSGLPWAEATGASVQNRKYNDKQFIEMHGLDEYDSQARNYYPAIGRTLTIDPLAEKYYSISPYAWCANNPVKYIDPDGRDLFDVTGRFVPGGNNSNTILVHTNNGDIPFSSLSMNSMSNRRIAANIAGYYAKQIGIQGLGSIGVANDKKYNSSEAQAFITGKDIFLNARGGLNSLLNDKHNMKSTLFHEKIHKVLGHGESDITNLTHAEVYINQMKDITFLETTEDFQKETIGGFMLILKDAYIKDGAQDAQIIDLINNFNKSNNSNYQILIKFAQESSSLSISYQKK